MRTSTLFVQKTFRIFRNLWCVRTDKGEGGLSRSGHFADLGFNFSLFCADVFYVGTFLEIFTPYLLKPFFQFKNDIYCSFFAFVENLMMTQNDSN